MIDPPGGGQGELSRREREVAALVARGLSNRAIAAELSIAEKTAANHIEHIMTKLDLRSRAQIAVWAVRRGLAADGPAGRDASRERRARRHGPIHATRPAPGRVALCRSPELPGRSRVEAPHGVEGSTPPLRGEAG